MILIFAIVGSIHTLIEMLSYIFLYAYISAHNKQMGVEVLDVTVINKRNQANAASLTGLIACWFLKVLHIILAGLISIVFERNTVREFSALFEYFQFYLIPLLEVNTSPAIKRFLSGKD